MQREYVDRLRKILDDPNQAKLHQWALKKLAKRRYIDRLRDILDEPRTDDPAQAVRRNWALKQLRNLENFESMFRFFVWLMSGALVAVVVGQLFLNWALPPEGRSDAHVTTTSTTTTTAQPAPSATSPTPATTRTTTQPATVPAAANSVPASAATTTAPIHATSHHSYVGGAIAAAIWAIACAAVGAIMGFLFGFPRTSGEPVRATAISGGGGESVKATAQSGTGAGTAAVDPGTGDRRAPSEVNLLVNNNLADISDWLTKIIVGLGLVHLGSIGRFVRSASIYATDCGMACPPFAAAVFIAFAALGFLFAYLCTRMFLAPAFQLADRGGQEPPLSEAVDTLNRPATPITPSKTVKAIDEVRGELATDAARSEGQPAGAPTARSFTDAARQVIRSFSGASELKPEQRMALARAELVQGSPDAALKHYQELLNEAPDDPQIHYDYALALVELVSPNHPKVLEHLQAAAQRAQRLSPMARAELFNWLIYLHLFDEQNQAFDKAIQYAQQFLRTPGAIQTASIYLNLACAYAQKYKFLKENRPDNVTDRQEIKKRFLDAVRNTLLLDTRGTAKRRLQQLLEPDRQKDPTDNDLEVFNTPEHNDVRVAIGLAPKPPTDTAGEAERVRDVNPTPDIQERPGSNRVVTGTSTANLPDQPGARPEPPDEPEEPPPPQRRPPPREPA